MISTSIKALITTLIVVLIAPLVIYFLAVGLACLVWVQRWILYLNRAPIALGTRLDIPESLGFLKNQIVPFFIPVPDDGAESLRIKLYAWLIAPLKVYADHEKEFLNDEGPERHDVEASAAFKLLREDEESRLVIYFHGNSATLGQPRRTDEYRILSSASPSKIFILTFDYRGFGLSNGTPTEPGLTSDGIAIVRWAIDVARIPPSRILLFSQSLGTAVATAVTHHFLCIEKQKIEFAGLMLCAAFTDAANVFLDFRILGKVPLMGLVKVIPGAAKWYRKLYRDRWMTRDRLVEIVRTSEKCKITLLHAVGDVVIPWKHCETLFYAAVMEGTRNGKGLVREEIEKRVERWDLGEGGFMCRWVDGERVLKMRIVKYGGHDTMMKWEPVALLVMRAFDLA